MSTLNLDLYLAETVEHLRQAVLVNHRLTGMRFPAGSLETISCHVDPRADGSQRAWALVIVGDPDGIAECEAWLRGRFRERILSTTDLPTRDAP